jgi:vacuolar protein sorting-associated protein 16
MDLMEGWALLRDRYYRKMELYEMSWENIDLNRLRLVGGPLGGPIGMFK